MKKVLVIYSSKYGHTEKYAGWIAEELKADICNVKGFNRNRIKDYDVIILGGGLYAGNIMGIKIIVNNYEKIKDRKIVLFSCGLADCNKIENINSINKRLEETIPRNILENIKVFNLRGGINYNGLTWIHKMMMKLVKKMVMKKGLDKLNEMEKGFMETYGKTVDFSDKDNIKGIIDYCKS